MQRVAQPTEYSELHLSVLKGAVFYHQPSCAVMCPQSFPKLALKELFCLILGLSIYSIKKKKTFKFP